MTYLTPSQLRSTRRPSRRRGIALLDAIIGGLILAMGVGTVMSVTGRAVRQQARGEKRVVAVWLADELLNMVMVEGPIQFPRVQDNTGSFEMPFDEYSFDVHIEDRGRGAPFRVTASVWWGPRTDQTISLQTLIAERQGDEPDEPREPEEEVDREARYYDEDEQP